MLEHHDVGKHQSGFQEDATKVTFRLRWTGALLRTINAESQCTIGKSFYPEGKFHIEIIDVIFTAWKCAIRAGGNVLKNFTFGGPHYINKAR